MGKSEVKGVSLTRKVLYERIYAPCSLPSCAVEDWALPSWPAGSNAITAGTVEGWAAAGLTWAGFRLPSTVTCGFLALPIE